MIEVHLIRSIDGKSTTAWLVPFTVKHSADFNTFWRERPIGSTDEDQYWDWERKKQLYLASGMEGQIQRKKIYAILSGTVAVVLARKNEL